MATINPQGPVVRVKAQDNVYTALLLIAILALAVAIGMGVYNLSANYGVSFGEMFSPLKK